MECLTDQEAHAKLQHHSPMLELVHRDMGVTGHYDLVERSQNIGDPFPSTPLVEAFRAQGARAVLEVVQQLLGAAQPPLPAPQAPPPEDRSTPQPSTRSSASPVARASLMSATDPPCNDSQISVETLHSSQVSGDSETFVPAYFVSPKQNQSSILFQATPLRQQRLNDSERKEKRSECAFPCAFSCECGMQLSCDVRFRVFLACATHFAPRRSKPQTDKQLQTKRARTEVYAGPGTWGIPAVLCSCVCGVQLSCGVRFRIFVACATHFVVRRSKPQTDKQRQTTQVVVRRSKPQTDKQRQTKRASAEVCAGAGTRGIPAASSKLEEADCPGFSEKKPKVGRAVATENSSTISLLPLLAC